MTKNEIKRTALEKLGKLVSSELKYYEDTNQFCQGLEISKDKFTDEENQEISNILESIKNRDGLVFFCDMNDIKSPALSYNNMSLKVKTYTCPNCGAQITNTHNCEYCGSSLVQFAVHGIDVTKTGYMNDDYVFPGLKKQLEKNLKLQTEHPYSAVATEVFWEFPGGAVNPFSIRRSGSLTGWSDNTPIDLESCDNGLRIALDFCKFNDSSYACKRFNDRQDSQLSKFKELDSFPLFTSHYCHSINAKDETERYGYQYALDFGEDVEGAARLVSEILTKVYGVSLESNFYMYTNVGRMIGSAREMWCKLHGYAYDANDANDDDDDEEEDTSTTQNSGCMVAATALLVPAVYTVIKLLGTML